MEFSQSFSCMCRGRRRLRPDGYPPLPPLRSIRQQQNFLANEVISFVKRRTLAIRHFIRLISIFKLNTFRKFCHSSLKSDLCAMAVSSIEYGLYRRLAEKLCGWKICWGQRLNERHGAGGWEKILWYLLPKSIYGWNQISELGENVKSFRKGPGLHPLFIAYSTDWVHGIFSRRFIIFFMHNCILYLQRDLKIFYATYS